MNPAIPTNYAELGRWLQNFAASHAKREHPAVVAHVEMEDAREGRSYGLRLSLGPLTSPPAGSLPMEVDYADVAQGRTRFAWCEALALRVRAEGRSLLERSRQLRSA